MTSPCFVAEEVPAKKPKVIPAKPSSAKQVTKKASSQQVVKQNGKSNTTKKPTSNVKSTQQTSKNGKKKQVSKKKITVNKASRYRCIDAKNNIAQMDCVGY